MLGEEVFGSSKSDGGNREVGNLSEARKNSTLISQKSRVEDDLRDEVETNQHALLLSRGQNNFVRDVVLSGKVWTSQTSDRSVPERREIDDQLRTKRERRVGRKLTRHFQKQPHRQRSLRG